MLSELAELQSVNLNNLPLDASKLLQQKKIQQVKDLAQPGERIHEQAAQ